MNDEPLLRALRELQHDPLQPVERGMLASVARKHRRVRRRQSLTAAGAGVSLIVIVGALIPDGTGSAPRTGNPPADLVSASDTVVVAGLHVGYLPMGLVEAPRPASKPSDVFAAAQFRLPGESLGQVPDVIVTVVPHVTDLTALRAHGLVGYEFTYTMVRGRQGLLGVQPAGRAVVLWNTASGSFVRVDARSSAEAEQIAASIE